MENFEGKSLKKTFPKIIFGNLAGIGANASAAVATNNMVATRTVSEILSKQPSS
jgi:hypothetical protein